MATKKHSGQKLALEKAASEFRQRHGFNDRQPIRLRTLLQDLDMLTVYRPLSDAFAGMALKVSEVDGTSQRFMLVNSNQTLGRQHFTICHELYHLFVQPNFIYQYCNPGQFKYADPEELNADWFAAYLLMPRDGILMQIDDWDELDKNQIKLPTILKIEQAFSCSRQALLVRLEEIGLIDKGYGEPFSMGVKQSAVRHGYSTELYDSGNSGLTIGDYGTMARVLFDKEEISESHYVELLVDLGINPADLAADYVPNNTD
jgi:Zn-dependent peptidase ImmA (M78 family)